MLLSAIGMPVEAGYVLIRAVREREEGKSRRTAAIAMSGFISRLDHETALRAGFEERLGKPSNPQLYSRPDPPAYLWHLDESFSG
jgi:CheY-like chemotaxis protein